MMLSEGSGRKEKSWRESCFPLREDEELSRTPIQYGLGKPLVRTKNGKRSQTWKPKESGSCFKKVKTFAEYHSSVPGRACEQ